MEIHQIRELLQRYQTGNCTASEIKLIENWYQQLIDTGEWQWEEGERDAMQATLERRIMKEVLAKRERTKSPVFQLKGWYWWAAASVILLLGTFRYFRIFKNPSPPEHIAKVVPSDIKAPQVNRAMITLSKGQKIFLDSAGSGALAVQGNMKLVKLPDGKIVYENIPGEIDSAIQYNTLTNPRGSKMVNIVLADGSKIWLDAGSALTYPVAFIGNNRRVSIKGEAYFEVAHDASKPFIVNNSSMNIQVLGTHFNVNTFEDDDQNVKVTLLEGLIKINSGTATRLLKPGQQALVNKEIKILDEVDLEAEMAWKNGYFYFDNASLYSVLKQISRWYNIDIIYEGSNHPRKFAGGMQRDLNLSEILKILEKNKVQFKIAANKLIVLPD